MKQEKRKRCTFNLFQVVLILSLGVILGVIISSIPIIPLIGDTIPPEIRMQQSAQAAMDDTSPKLLAVGVMPTTTPTVTAIPTATATVTPTATPPTTATVTPTATSPTTATVTPTATPPTIATVTPTATPPTIATVTPTATSAKTETSKSLTITTCRSINMYAKPDTDSAKKQKIPKGANLTNVTEIGGGWLRATYNGETGCIYYLYTSFLQEKKIFSPVYKVIFRQHTTGVVTADRVNLRSCPGITAKSDVIATLSANTRVEIVSHVEMIDDEEFGWLEIIVVGSKIRGFLYEKFVSVNVTFRIDSNKDSSSNSESNTSKTPSSNNSESNTGKKSSSSSSRSNTGKKSSSSSSRSNTGKKTSSNSSKRDTGKTINSFNRSKKYFKGVKLQYSAKYHITTNPLTRSGGIKRYNGHVESWYSEKTKSGGGLSIPGRHNDTADGTIRDKDGYICVASRDLPKHTILMTSLGPGKVYDWCSVSGRIDVYVSWDPPGQQKQQVKQQHKQVKKQHKQVKKQHKQLKNQYKIAA